VTARGNLESGGAVAVAAILFFIMVMPNFADAIDVLGCAAVKIKFKEARFTLRSTAFAGLGSE
jgi:hypothetical protein